jgi:hypothetical protein
MTVWGLPPASDRNLAACVRPSACGRELMNQLKAANISLLTTTQGVIADDFDAFEHVSWFTSAYLVSIRIATGKTNSKNSIID